LRGAFYIRAGGQAWQGSGLADDGGRQPGAFTVNEAPRRPAGPPAGRARRWLAVATVGGLLVATAAAFVVTEKLKLTPAPIVSTQVSKTFSPVCGCLTSNATISFRLRRGGRIEVDVLTAGGTLTRRLARRRFRAGFVFFRWFGRGPTGSLSPDGDYKIRVQLFSEHRAIVLPNIIRLITVPPTVERFRITRRSILIGQRLRVEYRFNESAHPILFIDGRQAVLGRFAHASGTLDWYGKVALTPIRRGIHRLALAARDSAGNTSPVTASIAVRVARPAVRPAGRRKR